MTLTGTVSQFNFGTGAGLVVRGPFNFNRGSVLKLYWTPGDYAHFSTSDVDVIIGKDQTFRQETTSGEQLSTRQSAQSP